MKSTGYFGTNEVSVSVFELHFSKLLYQAVNVLFMSCTHTLYFTVNVREIIFRCRFKKLR